MNDRHLVIAVLLAAVLDATVMPLCALGPFRPALWLTVVTYAALMRRAGAGMIVGACGGLLVDALSPHPFGAHMAGGIVVGFLTGHVWRAVYRDRLPAQLACVFVGVVTCDVVARAVAGADSRDLGVFLAQRSLPAAAATALVGPLLASIVVHLLRWNIRWDHGANAR